jgi:AAA+ ATPase superfamily predicted ATPase
MSLEDDVPTRRQIAAWLKEANEEEKGKRPDRSLPEVAAIRANHRAKISEKLEKEVQSISKEAKEKILSDLDSYKESPKPERITRQF